MGILRYAESVILSTAKKFQTILSENLTALGKYGATQQTLANFQNAITTAEGMKNGTELDTDLKEDTIVKNTGLAASVEWCDELYTRWKLAYRDRIDMLSLFPAELFNAAKRSENKMMALMPTLISLCTSHKTDLEPKGQPLDYADQGTTLLIGLSGKDATQEDTKEDNKGSNQARYQVFNTLYDTVNEITLMGRKTFKNDPAKLVLFNSPWPKRNGGSDEENPPVPPPTPAE